VCGIGYFSPWIYRPLLRTLNFMHQEELKILGRRIRVIRKSRNWSQEFLADQAEIDRSYIGGVERGERNLTFTVLCQICAALGCDVAELTQGIPGKHK
jgi:transcriptional regulator with XRE-family HTH domain